MTKLEQRIHDNKNGLNYVLVGDYYIPDLSLSETDERPIGRWGMLHKAYLKEYRSSLYNELVLTCKLNNYLADLNEQAQERLDLIIQQMQTVENINEALKRRDSMEWCKKQVKTYMGVSQRLCKPSC
ncbi:MAG: TnpV protein [Eubacteriales bacterium]|nr:TnpV protein [Eubacteriales bacterium]